MTTEIRATAAYEPSQEIGIAKRIVRYWLNGWFLTLQLGTGEHTVRDKSQAGSSKKERKDRVLMDSCKNGSFSIRNEWSPIRQSHLIEGSQEWRIPAHSKCS